MHEYIIIGGGIVGLATAMAVGNKLCVGPDSSSRLEPGRAVSEPLARHRWPIDRRKEWRRSSLG